MKVNRDKVNFARYVVLWLAAITIAVLGSAMFVKGIHGIEEGALFWWGLLVGVILTTAYFMVWYLATPLVRWLWARVRGRSQDFRELLADWSRS